MMDLGICNKTVLIALFCAIFCFEWSIQDKLNVHIPNNEVLEIRKEVEVCSKETGVSADNLKKIIDSTLPKDKPHSDFFYCVTHKAGYLDKDGNLIVESMLKFKVDGSEDEYKNSIIECNKITKEDAVDKARAVAECIHNKYKFSVLK